MVVVLRSRKENFSIAPLADFIEDEPQPRQRGEQSSAPADQPPVSFQAAQFAEWRRRQREEELQ